ncbi:hypothetical protein B0H19DRAFT_1375604 [Mycena capillaripes]|nr:hypothetical protein B0H19DRAFT_1375604 [Mycena capillaripes]
MNSPFNNILYTNTVPSDAECDNIRNFLEAPQKELADVTEEIDRLQSLIDEAARKRERLQHFIDAHLALVSPVRRLPDDVVRDVFVATLPSGRNPTIISDEGPLLLCRICKSWRTVALTTPRLWASLHIVVPTSSKLKHLVDLVINWLKRSGTVPLEISMVYSKICHPDDSLGEPDWSNPYDISPLLSALAAASHRWKNMQLILPNLGFASPLARLSSGDVPLLETIGLCTPDGSAKSDSFGPLAFLTAESLRSITFTGTHSFANSPVSWTTLTHLSITHVWPVRVTLPCALALAILPQCTMLRVCELVLSNDPDKEEASIQHFSLPQLSRLSVTNFTMASIANIGDRFFQYMTLPDLRSFRLDNPYNLDLTRLVSFSSIDCLRLDIEGLGTDTLRAALADMPLLQELVLLKEPRSKEQVEEPDTWRYWKSVPGDEHFLSHITPCSDRLDTTLCPELRRVEFLNFSAVSDESLLQFVQRRTEFPRAHLSQVTAIFRRPVQLDIIPHLQDAVVGGLFISLRYEDPEPVVTYSAMEGSTNPSLYMLPYLYE